MSCCTPSNSTPRQPKPKWLRAKLPGGPVYQATRELVDKHKLHTICQSGNCPNMGECWGNGTATFMILGNICTRSCRFCAVATGRPLPVDYDEPQKVAETIFLMKVKHAVITSVDRDELKDGGASIWHNTIKAVKALCPTITLETLIPDFKGDAECVRYVASAEPEVVSHNLETVERLTRQVRMQAKYRRSLEVLSVIKKAGRRCKTGIMLGLGETQDEVKQTMQDAYNAGVDVITIGQYLQPTPRHLPVQRFVTPEEFEEYKHIGFEIGFDYVESGPLVRSSYKSETQVQAGVWRANFSKQYSMANSGICGS